MSQTMVDLWNASAQAFDQRYQQIGEQWEAATPCDEFNVQQLCEHAVGVQAGMVAGLVGAEVAEGAAWPEVYAAVSANMNEENLAGTTNHPAMGEVPKARLLGIAISDLSLHAWDLAKGLDVDTTLPDPVVMAVHEGLKQFPEAMMRGPGMFGPVVEVPEGASAQDQMIAFAGRQP